ncbi:mitochondrial carrier [Hypoxylon trugodes]|uniref:mitochondrial carrier n=1 Tax=Hypoxylon trugodes TaxID=326681 RepID=UPI0021A0CCE6|nr:mitochondrial carrier [Hypoxylon trugodes]KAI1388449.1 mitochondrial carrier [Hypoxylon trugodes]
MDIPKVITELEMEMDESQNQRDARVEQLWRKLDYQGTGELDWKGLQKGLRRIDHPLKNADDMLKTIIRVVDTNGDGKIQYEEFRVFVEAAERQLYVLFKSIDRDQNGKIDKEELHHAVQRAGLAVPMRRLDEFFENIDHNRDGFITYEEWRNFLLFMPNTDSTTTLRAVFTFYSDILTLNSEGDSVVSEETLQGLGTNLLYTLFGSILRLASPEIPPDESSTSQSLSSPSSQGEERQQQQIQPEIPTAHINPTSNDTINITATTAPSYTHTVSESAAMTATTTDVLLGAEQADTSTVEDIKIESSLSKKSKRSVLIKYIPDPGYFIAGAVAGGISRTATAPLDRLKVYLLVNTTSSANVAVDAAKKGQAIRALKHAGRPLVTAVADIYKAGGIRGFFAGNGLNVVKIMPETAIRFGAYEAAKKTLASLEGHNDTHHINPYSKFVAGGVAGMTAQFCVYPLDTLKFRLQSEYVSGGARGNALLFQTARKMWTEGGVRAAYRGVTMGLVGMFPYSAIDMGTFELLKTTYITYRAKAAGIHEEDAQPTTFATGIMGATSGAFGASVVYPLNVLRTRLQTQGTSMHPAHYTGIWDVAHKTIRNEGFRGLYKGLMPNLLKVAPALSITWMVYENAKRILHLN